MHIEPASLNLDESEQKFELGFNFVKVDVKQRTVEGFATLDNIDNARDVVDNSASVDAFKAWAGNVREMHQKVAVGRALNASPKQYTDPDTGKTYDGLWVKTRVSTGAEDTWQKVLDGTLAGFSVGGAILETRQEMGPDNRPIRRITKYRLNELSLVDSPCNQLATIAMIKMDGDDIVFTDVVDEGELEKVTFKAERPISKFLPKKVRERESQAGQALGPIKAQEHVDYASQLVNDAKDPYALRAHILQSSQSLGLRLPAGWDSHKFLNETDKKVTKIDDLAKDDSTDEPQDMDEMTEADHLSAAQGHLKYAARHAANRDDHHGAADLHRTAGDLDYAKQKAMLHQVKSMNKDTSDAIKDAADLLDKTEPANNIKEADSMLQKVLNIVRNLGQDKEEQKTLDNTFAKYEEETKSKEQETEMDEETLRKSLEGFGEDLSKTLKKKLGGMHEDLSKDITDATKASSEAIDELKNELKGLSDRLTTLETSGAVSKSNDPDAGEKKLEKSNDEGLWADAIVPSFLKERFGGK